MFKLAERMLGGTTFFYSSKKLEGAYPFAILTDPLFEKVAIFLFLVCFKSGVFMRGVYIYI